MIEDNNPFGYGKETSVDTWQERHDDTVWWLNRMFEAAMFSTILSFIISLMTPGFTIMLIYLVPFVIWGLVGYFDDKHKAIHEENGGRNE